MNMESENGIKDSVLKYLYDNRKHIFPCDLLTHIPSIKNEIRLNAIIKEFINNNVIDESRDKRQIQISQIGIDIIEKYELYSKYKDSIQLIERQNIYEEIKYKKFIKNANIIIIIISGLSLLILLKQDLIMITKWIYHTIFHFLNITN
jgi:hypothetical protein